MDYGFVAGVAGAVVCGFIAFAFYAIYGGSRASLANASDGQVFNFVYEQPLNGTRERFLAKVIGRRTLTADEISRLNRRSRYRSHDPEFLRTANLVTCRTRDGKVRNFYAERTSKCRRPLLVNTLFG